MERDFSNSMSAIICACASSSLPMMSPTMGSRRLWKTYPHCEISWRPSATIISLSHGPEDILETFLDRGQLRKLTKPTVLPSGKRIPGLKLDHPRQLALMHALVCFAHIAAGSTFTTAELYPYVLAALQTSSEQYSLASLRSLPTGVFHLPGISQTLRACLFTAHCRLTSALPGGLQTRAAQANPTGSPLPKDRRRPR